MLNISNLSDKSSYLMINKSFENGNNQFKLSFFSHKYFGFGRKPSVGDTSRAFINESAASGRRISRNSPSALNNVNILDKEEKYEMKRSREFIAKKHFPQKLENQYLIKMNLNPFWVQKKDLTHLNMFFSLEKVFNNHFLWNAKKIFLQIITNSLFNLVSNRQSQILSKSILTYVLPVTPPGHRLAGGTGKTKNFSIVRALPCRRAPWQSQGASPKNHGGVPPSRANKETSLIKLSGLRPVGELPGRARGRAPKHARNFIIFAPKFSIYALFSLEED
uniref:hypothetical protein n=1 Tax=Cephaleuros karstenii TaxID=1985640 RepID=UPI001EE12594|nr:hypothetical protein MFR52_pgp092 [Cephaleuros karstenii]UIB39067.1 hypothetical protein [Cephaleuros karstenii]